MRRVVDGDTYVLDIDTGFNVHHFATIRLRGWSCPEMNTPAGINAAGFVATVLVDRPLIVETYKDTQSFARWIADVYVGGSYLGVHLGPGVGSC
jgi:hypothetical protein